MAVDPTTFLPAADPPISPEAALADVTSLLTPQADLTLAPAPTYPLGRSWAFDWDRRRFVSGRGPLQTHGRATLRHWIAKCLQTERGAFAIHPPDYGVDGLEDLIGEPLVESLEVEDRVREALLFHPAITDVTDFVMWTDEDLEALFVSFTVITDSADDLMLDALRLGA